MASIFTKIMQRQIPAEFIYEDDQCIVIKDIQPVAPIHLLIIPRKEISSVAEMSPEDASILGHLLFVAQKVAKQLKIHNDGFRLITNSGENAGQTVFHLHIHFIAGKKMGWPS